SDTPTTTDALLAQLAGIDYLQGNFEQTQQGQNGKTMATSSGRFQLLRPGFFSWEILSPDSQLIIANPEFLWHHDRDLETVTRRPVAGSEQMAPLQVLGGDEDILRERFTVNQSSDTSFTLIPVASDPGFQHLTLTFSNGTLVSMQILDSLNQQVEVRFSNLDSTTPLAPEDFAFSPPDGADLFYYDE
ncbi:MAG: outer membrane lipoprotein chaperone LolA, partial [Halieaceae bacterium]